LDREAQIAAIQDLVTPVLTSIGLELFDLHITGSGRGRTLQVMVERAAGEGDSHVDLDTIARASQAISPLLDDDRALAGPFLLEVTSPGIERPLRRPEHFRRAIGETVSVKFHVKYHAENQAGNESQRLRGTLTAAGDTAIDVDVDGEARHIAYPDIADARTVFEWGPSPRPGKGGRAQQQSARKKEKSRS
jgi:ribosome maturation factor RimP